MNKTLLLSEIACKGAYTLTLGSTLMGGHLLLSYLFFKPDSLDLETCFSMVLILIGINFFYFLFALVLQLFQLPMKSELKKATLGMLSNIPIAMFYLFILFSYGL